LSVEGLRLYSRREMLFKDKIFLHPHPLFIAHSWEQCLQFPHQIPISSVLEFPYTLFSSLCLLWQSQLFSVCVLAIVTHVIVSQYTNLAIFPLPGYTTSLFLVLSLCYIHSSLPEMNYGGNCVFAPALGSTMPDVYVSYLSREPTMYSSCFSVYVHYHVI